MGGFDKIRFCFLVCVCKGTSQITFTKRHMASRLLLCCLLGSSLPGLFGSNCLLGSCLKTTIVVMRITQIENEEAQRAALRVPSSSFRSSSLEPSSR